MSTKLCFFMCYNVLIFQRWDSSDNLKLPDAIIAATVFTSGTILITNDKVFSQVKEIKIKSININTA